MGGNNSKSPENSNIEDANFDLPGCLESLSDMAQTGKTSSFRKSSTTSRALWGMSRALSAPVATQDYLTNRPSLERTKAVSLDTYSPQDHPSTSSEAKSVPMPSRRAVSHKGLFSLCVKGGLSTIEAEEDSDDAHACFPQESHIIPGSSSSSYTSPAIEVSPPETEESQLLHVKEKPPRKGNASSGRNVTAVDSGGKISPRDATARLQVPSKHTLLQEKRKKFLRKSSPVDEDQVEDSRLLKEHSQDKAPDWEHIQEWMVWCIHENLDSSDEESSDLTTTTSSSSPIRSNPFSKLVHLQEQHLQHHSMEERYLLPSHQRQYMDSPSTSRTPPPRPSAVLQRNRSIPSRTTPALSPLHRSVVDIGIGNPSERAGQRRKGSLSLDGQRSQQQSSFESSGSSRMNSFDSTGTHNEHL